MDRSSRTVRRLASYLANYSAPTEHISFSFTSTMGRGLRTEWEGVGWETSPRTMLNDLDWAGVYSTRALRDLEKLFQLRNAIAQCLVAPAVDLSAVRHLVETARRLLTESQLAKQTVLTSTVLSRPH